MSKSEKPKKTRFINLTGQRFNCLTAVRPVGKDKYAAMRWLCRCDCGNTLTVRAANLRRGRPKSCGCKRKAMVNLSGKRFGRLIALKENPGQEGLKSSVRKWQCLCSCGTICYPRYDHLMRGESKSCGCLKHDAIKTHGKSTTKEYKIWAVMWQRCENPKNKAYKNYGGRGMKVSQKWRDFGRFYRDMGPCPSGHSLDRKNNNEGYSPRNCRWATKIEQANNTRRTKILMVNGQRIFLPDLAETLGYKRYFFTKKTPEEISQIIEDCFPEDIEFRLS